MATPPELYRVLEVPERAAGLRLDRFLALRFQDRSRSALVRAIRAGQVMDAAFRPLRASLTLRGDEVLHLTIPGIAPSEPPPPFPEVLYEDARVAVINKPPGIMAHPAGTRFVYALVGLAKTHWPDHRVDLVHRLDRDTSGVMVLTKDVEANAYIKAHMRDRACVKVYLAITKGVPEWDEAVFEGPIGEAGGVIRVQRGVVPDGLPSRTDATVVGRKPDAGLAMVRCRIHTGRTHQIRVHLSHAGFPLLGDLLYGVPPDLFLGALEHGVEPSAFVKTGAPRHALHASSITFPHPDGDWRTVHAPLPADMQGWWDDPAALPWEGLPTP